MGKPIVKFDEIPKYTWQIEKYFPEKHKAIIRKDASIEIPWGNERLVLWKLRIGYEYEKITNKTNAKKNKLKISEKPVAYTIQKFDFRIILLYEIL